MPIEGVDNLGVSQFADGPVSDAYRAFVHNRYEMAKARRAKFLTRDANDLFEPRKFTSLAEVNAHFRLRIRELHGQTPTSLEGRKTSLSLSGKNDSRNGSKGGEAAFTGEAESRSLVRPISAHLFV